MKNMTRVRRGPEEHREKEAKRRGSSEQDATADLSTRWVNLSGFPVAIYNNAHYR